MGRKLKSRSEEFIGVDQKVWINSETGGYGDSATGGKVPADGGAVDFNDVNVGFDIPREDSASRSGRSVVARLSGKKTVEVKVESHIIPGNPDALGNPALPPMHPLLLTSFGEVDQTDPAKIVYKLSRSNANSVRILEEATHYSRLVCGVIADSLTFALPGDGKATMSLEGFGQDAYIAGESKLAQAITGAEQKAVATIQSLDYVAKAGLGKDGNYINISLVDKDGVGLDGTVKTTVTGYDIVVQCDTAAMPDADALIVLLTDVAVQALIDIPTITSGGNGTDVQALHDKTYLEGGLGEFDIKVEDGIKFEAGSYVDIIQEADGDTVIAQARQVVAICAPPSSELSGVNKNIITLDSVAIPAAAVGDYVIGHAPETYSPLTSEYALLGLKGSFSAAGFSGACDLVSAEISIANNFTKKDFVYGTSKIQGFLPDKRREVSVKLDILLTKETFAFYMRNKQFIAEDVTITLEPQDIPGPSYASGKGRTFVFNMPKVEFNIPPIENPADGYVTLSLEGKALAPSANQLDEEFTLTIQ